MAAPLHGPVSSYRFRPRARLRHATFIDPKTGSRLKKRFTLRDVDGHLDTDGNDDDRETTPLLSLIAHPSTARRGTLGADLWQKCKNATQSGQKFLVSETGKGVLKCSIAYVLGSMATFVPALRDLLGTQDSKHLVATITVYFHPARSMGSMFEALLLAFTAFVYTAFVAVTSMSVSVLFADKLHQLAWGHAVVLIVFVGGGFAFVGWVKLKKGDPLVNVACSLASLALSTILTKEGAVQAGDYSFAKIYQILNMIIMGVIATMTVCFTIFPIMARKKLKQNMLDVTDALADMLALSASAFVSGDEKQLEDEAFTTASERHKKAYSSLGKNLKEAKYEHYFLGTERKYHIEAKLVRCVRRITQSISGLRSAAAMQFLVLRQSNPQERQNITGRSWSWSSIPFTSSRKTGSAARTSSANPTSPALVSIAETADEDTEGVETNGDASMRASSVFNSVHEIFELFLDHLGPSMRSLAFTLKEILDELPYDAQKDYQVTQHVEFRVSLDRALEMYQEARHGALEAVYGREFTDKTRTVEIEADWEEAAASCGHFSFSLLEVAEQIKDYLVTLDELQLEIEQIPGGRSWKWLVFWQSSRKDQDQAQADPEVREVDAADLRFSLPTAKERQPTQSESYEVSRTSAKQRFVRWIYHNLAFLQRDDNKFAIKVGIGAVIYALPAFIVSTRPIYSHWRGEWGLLSYMLVCSMTIGASNTTGYSRFLGTCLGAVLAIAAWEASDSNPYLLAFFGFLMAYWTAYIIVAQGKGPMGRFIMLTYNLSALYAYSLAVSDEAADDRDGDEEDESRRPLILPIAGHRVVAVLSGVIWGLIVTRFVWPISARQKLKDGLALIWLRMGMIWKRDPLSLFLDGSNPTQHMHIQEELEMQHFLAKLESLVDAAKNEFELRGPFPYQTYGKILKSTGRMLDAFHEMNIVIVKDMQASPGEQLLLQTTMDERAQLCSRVSHLFTVLASSMKLEYPISRDALPNTEHTRDRLLARIFDFRRNHKDKQAQETKDEDFGLLYTFALMTAQLNLEIQNVLGEVENLFGVLDEEALRLQ